ncbi:nucleotidyltransferase family protein [Streptacidiphilus sp. PB12-B1b]|uniref:nucleotidyltransferase domain-containing protein n=1 Tax=Streptacidiphilus sp. PB12-B1b TaxID=2705012 RepID=UPI0015F7B8A3|nr:nucleotidyltransferase family protein [Streptacidiphilus sp. PB12-B1b]QMU78274.1 nucleotidyltransferase family protein [Streptacidiphilus sp. PB12-B1b]
MSARPEKQREKEFILRASTPFGGDLAADTDLDGFDWGFVLDTVFRHRVAALVGRSLAGVRGIEYESRREYVLDALLGAHTLNERRNRLLVAEAVRLVGLLLGQGVQVAVRKGAYLAPAVYRDPGLRPMNDIDLFVDRAAAQEVAALLKAEGYLPGRIDTQNRIIPLTRRQSVFWNVHVNNLPAHHRPSGDPCLPSIAVDVCWDLFLPASGVRLPARRLLDQASPFESDGGTLPVFRPEHFLLDVAAHLHKESTTLRYIEKGKHQRLLQYVDIVAVVRANPDLDWALLTAVAAEAGALRNVYFALANAERLFPSTVPGEVLDRIAADGAIGRDFLHEYGGIDLATPLRWAASDIAERLFSDERPGATSQSPV